MDTRGRQTNRANKALAWVFAVLAGPAVYGAIEGWFQEHVAETVAGAGLLAGGTWIGVRTWDRRRKKHQLVPAAADESADLTPLQRAASALARTVKEQWLPEVRRQEIAYTEETPRLIRIGCEIERLPDNAPKPLTRWKKRGGSVENLAELMEAIPFHKLVILGPPEAGKTSAAILTMLNLLTGFDQTADMRRERDDPVPVWLPLSTWDPELSLTAWLEQRLAEDFPWLRVAETYGEDAPGELVRGGMVIPVLDGLDEVPDANRATVIDALRDLPIDLPGLILTCRKEEYDGLGREPIKGGAVVVALEPVRPRQALEYFGSDATAFQESIRAELVERPGGPVAEALSSPFMVMLAHKAYGEQDSLPTSLLELRTKEQVEQHLLAAYLPALYPIAPTPERKAGGRWKLADARKWLCALADAMEQRGHKEIRWWEFSVYARPVSRLPIGMVAFILVSAAVGLAFWQLIDTRVGVLAGAILGVAIAGFCAANQPPRPSETQLRKHHPWQSVLMSGLPIGVLAASAGVLVMGKQGAWLGLMGVAVGLMYGLTGPNDTAKAISPRYLLHRDLMVGVIFFFVYGVPCGVIGVMVAGPLVGVAFGFASALAGGLLYGPFWFFAGQGSKINAAAFVHLTVAIGLLAPQGKLPWTPLRFLEDAHRLGLLRQDAGVYRFRHARLQEALAASGTTPTAGSTPTAGAERE